MRTLITIAAVLLLTTVVKAQLPSTELYQHFILELNPNKPDSAYGRIPEHPIRLGANRYINDPSRERKLLLRFARTYTWPDGSPLQFPNPQTVFLNGTNVDKYVLKKPGAADSLVLYVDMFNEGLVNVPEGLTLYSREHLGKDLAPLVDSIKTLFTVKDGYKNAAFQRKTFMYVNELQNVVGLDYLIDNDVLAPLMNVNDADADFKAYLIRTYIFHKFVNEATGTPEPAKKAYTAAAAEYRNVLALHPDLKKGSLDNVMKARS